MFPRIAIGRSVPALTALVLGLLVSGRPQSAESQERPSTGVSTETPEQVTEQLVAATRNADWAGMARLMHPAALAEFRSLFDVLLETRDAEAASLRKELFGVESAAEARSLPDTVIFANLMRVILAQEEAGLGEALRTAEVRVMGHVQEGADTVHVVYRLSMTVENIPISMMDVASLTRYGPTWRGLLKGDLRAMAAGMREAMLKKS